MEASEGSPDRPACEVPRDAILIALAAAAGAVDVISLLGLGGVFTANMSSPRARSPRSSSPTPACWHHWCRWP
jgi:hypothetical protein